MSSLQFGNVKVTHAIERSGLASMLVAVDGGDKEPFRPLLEKASHAARTLANANADAWNFTLIVGPGKAPVMVRPGHFDELVLRPASEEPSPGLSALPRLADPARSEMAPFLQKVLPQVQDKPQVQKVLREWLG